jgi:NADPH-dependent curcumin reductase CurA
MTAVKNRQILLASRPRGEPTLDNFKLIETDVPEPGPGHILLRVIYLSLDPYMRGRMNAGPSYAKAVEVGEVMEGRSVCEVVKSNLSLFTVNDLVVAGIGWQEYALRPPAFRDTTRESVHSDQSWDLMRLLHTYVVGPSSITKKITL